MIKGEISLGKEKAKLCPWCKTAPVLIKECEIANPSPHSIRYEYKYHVACRNPKCMIKPKTQSYYTLDGLTKNQCIDHAIYEWNKNIGISDEPESANKNIDTTTSFVNVDKLINKFTDMSRREVLITDISKQEDLLIQIIGTIIKVSKEE